MFETWTNRNYKVKIYFTDSLVYEASSDTSNQRVKSLSWNETEGSTTGNIMGIKESNKATITLFDIYDKLSPSNAASPYYGHIKTGKKVEIYKEMSDGSYEKDRDYYITSISGSYAEGIAGEITFGVSDRYFVIANETIDKIEAYVNIPISQLIVSVLTSVGVDKEDIIFDSRLDANLSYGVTYGQTVKEFINGCCQILFARCVIDKKNRFLFIPAFDVYENSRTWDVTEEIIDSGLCDISKLKNSVNTSMNYGKVRFYYEQAGDEVGTQLSKKDITLVAGYNSIVINFDMRALQIDEIRFKKSEAGDISNIQYTAYQNAIEITCISDKSQRVNLIINGNIISTNEQYVEKIIDEDSTYSNSPFSFHSNILINYENEDTVQNKLLDLCDYINHMKHTIEISLKISDDVSIGDILNLDINNDTYRGIYKIISVSGKTGDPLKTLRCVLQKVIIKNVWDDSEYWDDDNIWED